MKRFIWLAAGLVAAGWTGGLRAQVVIVVPASGPAYYGSSYYSGTGFEYKSKHLKIGGFVYKGYSAASYGDPYGGVYAGPYPGGVYGPAYPGAVVQKNVTINVYPPGS